MTSKSGLPFVEDRIVRSFVSRMRKAGWELNAYIDDADGANEFVTCSKASDLLEWIYQVGDVWARFSDGVTSHCVRFIAGNDSDIISDYTTNGYDRFDETVDRITDELMEIYQK